MQVVLNLLKSDLFNFALLLMGVVFASVIVSASTFINRQLNYARAKRSISLYRR
jgi:hypothetical protein